MFNYFLPKIREDKEAIDSYIELQKEHPKEIDRYLKNISKQASKLADLINEPFEIKNKRITPKHTPLYFTQKVISRTL